MHNGTLIHFNWKHTDVYGRLVNYEGIFSNVLIIISKTDDFASGENYVIDGHITPYRIVTEKEMLVRMIKEAAGTNLFDKQIEEQIRNMDDGDVDIVYPICEQIYCQRKLDMAGSFKKIICEASEKIACEVPEGDFQNRTDSQSKFIEQFRREVYKKKGSL